METTRKATTLNQVLPKTYVDASLDPGIGRVAATVEAASVTRARGTGLAVGLVAAASVTRARGTGHVAATSGEVFATGVWIWPPCRYKG